MRAPWWPICVLPDRPALAHRLWFRVTADQQYKYIYCQSVTESGIRHTCANTEPLGTTMLWMKCLQYCRGFTVFINCTTTCMHGVCRMSNLFMGICGLLCAWWKGTRVYYVYEHNIAFYAFVSTALLFSLPSRWYFVSSPGITTARVILSRSYVLPCARVKNELARILSPSLSFRIPPFFCYEIKSLRVEFLHEVHRKK
jgi:hypothetical protein